MTAKFFSWFCLGVIVAIGGVSVVFTGIEYAAADTTSTAVTVNASVTASGSGISVCGNGSVETGEACDDSNTVSLDGCSATCLLETISQGGSTGVSAPIISNVTVTTTQTSADLAWEAVDVERPVTGCYINFGLSHGSYTAEVAAVQTGVRSFETALIAGLAAGTDYYYRITCLNNLPNSGVYFGVWHTNDVPNLPPVIEGVVTAPAERSAVISWRATDDRGIPECTFIFDRRNYPSSAPIPTSLPVTVLPNNEYQVSVPTLLPNLSYYFHITCVDALPNQTVFNSLVRTMPDATPPPDVLSFTLTPLDTQMVLNWVFPGTIDDTGSFMIRRGTAVNPLTVSDGVLVTSTINIGTRTWRDTGLVNDTRYYYTLFVFDTSGNHSGGVSANAAPRSSGDRDSDGVADDFDFCDSARVNQVNTPGGAIVDSVNGCPLVSIDADDLTHPITTIYPTMGTPNIGSISFRGAAAITAGLAAGSWRIESAAYGLTFTVGADGQISWPANLNTTFLAEYDAGGAHLVVTGQHLTLDSSRLDPRNQFRIFAPELGSGFLADIAEVSLLPNKNYWLGNRLMPSFFVSDTGSVIVGADASGYLSYGNGALTAEPVDVCVRRDTLVGDNRIVAPYGTGSYVGIDSVYRLLPTSAALAGATTMYIEAQSGGARRDFSLLMNPLRLEDPFDSETGPVINLTLNLQNVRAALGQCVGAARACGNAILELTEQCDDGNTENDDGCSSICNIEEPTPCGNGLLDPNETCDDHNLTDGDGCSSACALERSECGNSIVETGEQCDDGNTVGGDGCSSVCRLEPISLCGNAVVEPGETCDDGNTINGDGCSALCQIETPEALTQCSDGIDNDGDGFVDMGDAGCASPSDDSEASATTIPIVPIATEPGGTGSEAPQPIFLIGRGAIAVELVGGFVRSLRDDQLTVVVPSAMVGPQVEHADLILAGTTYRFVRNAETGDYRADVVVPAPGEYQALIAEQGASETVSLLSFGIASEPYGTVRESVTGNIIEAAEITVFGSGGVVWLAYQFGQQNPMSLGPGGTYGFVVPNGNYELLVSGPGLASARFQMIVVDHIINTDLTVLPPVRELLANVVADILNGDLGALLTHTGQLLDAGIRAVDTAVRAVKAFADNPVVEAVAEKVVVPSVATAAAVAVAPSLGTVVGPLLRYMFLQPLLVIGKRKRRQWGMVYNSLNKLPIDLATVRIVDSQSKRVLQSHVTDFSGRYIFFAEPGSYQLDVTKPGFLFPSKVLSAASADGRFVDLYHGESIAIKEEGTPVTPNVPVDPSGADKPPQRIVWEQRLRIVQHAVSMGGIVLTGISFFITPTLMVAGFFAGHVAVYALFSKFIRPPVPKQWGTIYDAKTKQPVQKAIVRLFTKEYNKLISTQITGGKGRYAFLAGPSAYYLSVQAPGHLEQLTAPIVPKTVERAFINKDVYIEPVATDSESPLGTSLESALEEPPIQPPSAPPLRVILPPESRFG